ncbi:MAG: thiamine phosphate synthase [Spirochaetaceae bacterium]|jgi:thiamine-phosphate pyrophosphorylase|nr:thiamine phosphate synthase [Spirochaetaceae bacterium]
MLDPRSLLLYLCTDRVLALGRPITEAVEAAIAGGVTMVQLREKDASTGEFYRIAREVLAVTRPFHVPLVINDRLDIALAIGAEGLHMGQSDLPLPAARRLAGKDMFIGLSASTVEEALRAQAEGADYLGVGAVYPTGSKADAGEVISLQGLAEIRAAVKIPVVGRGGVNAGNAAEVMAAGADGIALISGILSQPDIQEAARNLRRILDAKTHR